MILKINEFNMCHGKSMRPKKDLLDMKSLNLCSRLPNLLVITHLQKRKKVDILVQEMLILVNCGGYL